MVNKRIFVSSYQVSSTVVSMVARGWYAAVIAAGSPATGIEKNLASVRAISLLPGGSWRIQTFPSCCPAAVSDY
jgi:hypothetical protein